MGKIYLDKENRICVQTDSGVFKSDGKHELKFKNDEVFEMSADDVEKLMVIFSDERLRLLFYANSTDESIRYSGIWQDRFIEILTTDEAVNKIKEELKSMDAMYNSKSESYSRATDEIYNNKNMIKKHNELPWYKRFKKIEWQESKY